MLDNTRHVRWPIITDAEKAAVMAVLDRGILSGSAAPEALAFEREFADYVGAKYALLTHCGTSALHIALAAAGVKAGDEVIVPAYSFIATALAVLHHGALPVFVDVDARTGCIDPALIPAALSPRTRAIMPVHIHGAPADLDPILTLASEHNLVVIEDAAQAHGAEYTGAVTKNKKVGAIAHAGGFSLQSSKNLPAGEGGIFVTNDAGIAERAQRLRNFGENLPVDAGRTNPDRPLDSSRAYDSLVVGWMYRGNEMMAAFGRAQLKRLPELTERARANAERLTARLAALPGITPPSTYANCKTVHHKYRVSFDLEAAGLDGVDARTFRNALRDALKAQGLEVVGWQSQPLPGQSLFKSLEGYGNGYPWSIPGARDLTNNYDAANYPVTQRLLDTSIVLFSQSCPLIAQPADIVEAYADEFEQVWTKRADLAQTATREAAAR